MEPVVKAENLYFRYSNTKSIEITSGEKDRKWILENINFTINKGDFVVIAGKNGSGKSTLLRLIDLLLLPTKGKIYIFDKDLSEIADPYEVRSKIGFVFQNPKHQMITNTVLDEMAFGPENLGLPREIIKRRIEQAVKLTGIDDFLNRRTDELSGGQKQLVAIASVLTIDPEILLFDEPTSMLHPEYHNRIIKIIEQLNAQGKTVILVTHNSKDFLIGTENIKTRNRLFIISDGNLIYDADPKDLLENYKNIIDKNGLELPAAVRISKQIKDRLSDFPMCISIQELSEKISNYIGSK